MKGWQHTEWGDQFDVDVKLEKANPDEYDGLLLPGGVMNPDKLRTEPRVQRFVRAFFEAGKPVASIRHGPWTLIDAEVVKGRTLASYPSFRRDLENAGADWVDEEVVVDNGLVTSRKPDDIPAFNRKMLEEFAEGRHEGQRENVAPRQREGVTSGDASLSRTSDENTGRGRVTETVSCHCGRCSWRAAFSPRPEARSRPRRAAGCPLGRRLRSQGMWRHINLPPVAEGPSAPCAGVLPAVRLLTFRDVCGMLVSPARTFRISRLGWPPPWVSSKRSLLFSEV